MVRSLTYPSTRNLADKHGLAFTEQETRFVGDRTSMAIILCARSHRQSIVSGAMFIWRLLRALSSVVAAAFGVTLHAIPNRIGIAGRRQASLKKQGACRRFAWVWC